MPTVKQFEDLEIWKLARILCNDINKVAVNTNLKSDYKLYSQIDGSSGSIMDNIAEGFERNGNKEFIQFLSISKASCGETRSQLYRVLDRNYINEEKFNKLYDQTIVLGKMIGGFMNYLKKSDFKGSKYKVD
ncbi:four helix bundle protein [Flavivirga aquimarina]|uniref:Four helix bundle protein n=1 Tax=Flavivirga aquimarina TaxID=2027862 RepID=A0ABT8WGR4_9FLAO|nr:four helix bundle protein [Flavivirga aquimarina]MDO5972248.1 four helix bundle protein [Flavivirga aquimarina]